MKSGNGTDVVNLGNLDSAKSAYANDQLLSAWNKCLEALQIRPYHPEAFVLMGKIASTAGDAHTARRCAEKAHSLAPAWPGSRTFTPPKAKNAAKIAWPQLEEVLAAPTQPRISVCLIVKNEEAFLGKCLASIKSVASQIIVVDTGSTDRTVAIAQEAGAEVYFYAWNDDFSAARNAGLLHATGDWLLIMDADEELTAEGREFLKTELLNPKIMAYQMPMISIGSQQEGCAYLPRLFRNIPGTCYEGRVHEQLLAVMVRLTRNWGLDLGSSQATLLHYGYTAELTASRNKPQRNLRLLQQSLLEPDHDDVTKAYLLTQLGLETVRTGNLNEGIKCYQQSLILLNQRILKSENQPQISEEYRASVLQQYSTYLARANRPEEVIALFESPLAKSGTLSAADHYSLGLAYGQVGQFDKAALEFHSCLKKRHLPGRIPFPPIVLGMAPHHCLAIALTKLGRTAEAERAYQEGIDHLPNSVDLRIQYARFKHQTGRSIEALKELHQLLRDHANNTELWGAGAEICLSQPQFSEIGLDWTGEAIRLHPESAQLISLRGEALLLSGDLNGASGLLSTLRAKMGNQLNSRSLAAVLCCEWLGATLPEPVDSAIEPQTSQAFIELYSLLLGAGATVFIDKLNCNMETFAPILPTAVRLLTQSQTLVAA